MFVDEEEGDIDDKNDAELDGNDQLDLDLDSEHNDNLESDLVWLCRRTSVVPNSSRTGPKLENANLCSSPSLEFFKLFITGDFVTKMAEQTNFYAVQRGAPGSFKPLSDGGHKFIPLHQNPHRQLEKARDKFWMFTM